MLPELHITEAEYLGPDFWIYAWGLVTAFSVVVNSLYSSVIVPLFNKQTPLEDGILKDQITDYAVKISFDIKDIFVIDVEKYTHKPVEITLTKHETHIVNGKKIKLTLPEEGADMEVLIRSGAQKTSLRSATAELNFIRKRFPKYYKFMIA